MYKTDHAVDTSYSAVNNVNLKSEQAPKSTRVSQRLVAEITKAISNIRGWGSVEIFIQDDKVTQITERNILKTDALTLHEDHTS